MRTIHEVHVEQAAVLQTIGLKQYQRDTLKREIGGLCARIRVLEDEARQLPPPDDAPSTAQEQRHE